MITFLEQTHSILRYVVLFLLLWSVIHSFIKYRKKDSYTSTDDSLYLSTFIFTHIQLLIGLVLYFMGPKGYSFFKMDMGDLMSNAFSRFYAIEHPTGMLLAIILVTMGRILSKKQKEDYAKHLRIFIYFLIALVIIFISIPWPFRNLGTSWI